MILEIILGLLFIASLITIGFLGWYIRNLLNNLLYITENTIELKEEIICPSSLEANRVSSCDQCFLCDGKSKPVTIIQH